MSMLKQEFIARMTDLLGESADDFFRSLECPSEKSIYINQNKIEISHFKNVVDFSISQIPYESAGFYVDNIKLGRHPLHHAGAFYLQEPSAMFTVNALKFKGNERVLDLCSAPGGKTIQIANRVPNGVVVSNEISRSRCEILYSNVERMGLRNVIISNESTQNIANAYANTFDVVLVDAPCSGEGMFRKGEDMMQNWNPGLNLQCATRQTEILKNADACLKNGGYLIYSTCTYALEENELMVKDFLKNYNYELINIDYPFSRGVDLPETVRLYPHLVKGEGQFVAMLRKKEDNNAFSSSRLKLNECKMSSKFIKENTNMDTACYDYKNFSYYVPDLELVKNRINYLSIGVRVGEVKGKNFIPNHYLFSAFGDRFKHKLKLSVDDLMVNKYLKGEELEFGLDNCYGVVFVEGCALGGFKMSQGKFKNFYPKGLRNFK